MDSEGVPPEEPVIDTGGLASPWGDDSSASAAEFGSGDEAGEGSWGAERSLWRQVGFYVFLALGLAVLIGAAVIPFAAAGGDAPGERPLADFSVVIDSPETPERVETGQTLNFSVRATSTEPIAKLTLYREGMAVDEVALPGVAARIVERATLVAWFPTRGEYRLFVRVTTTSGATVDSETVRVVAIERIVGLATAIKGRVTESASLRRGPADWYGLAGTAAAGQQVTIRGRTPGGDWLLVDTGTGEDLWIRRSSVELAEVLLLVPVREPTATPRPAPIFIPPTPRPPTATASPTSPATPAGSVTATPTAKPTGTASGPTTTPGSPTAIPSSSTPTPTVAPPTATPTNPASPTTAPTP